MITVRKRTSVDIVDLVELGVGLVIEIEAEGEGEGDITNVILERMSVI